MASSSRMAGSSGSASTLCPRPRSRLGSQPRVRGVVLRSMWEIAAVDPSPPQAVLDHVAPHADVVVPMANGEPVALLDVLEAEHRRLTGVHIHQCTRSTSGPTS